MSGLDEAEYRKLAEVVEQAERTIAAGKLPADGILANFVVNAKLRMEVLEADAGVFQERDKKDRAGVVNAAIVAMLERETRLSELEKEAYGEFLEKEYFTRNDFGDLERLYADGGAWDRLSEKGKAEMSKRIDEGIRRGEFALEDLPDNVKSKHQGETHKASQEKNHQGLFEYQLVDTQAATEHSDVAAAREKESEKSQSTEKLISKSDDELLGGFAQNPTELKPPSFGKGAEIG